MVRLSNFIQVTMVVRDADGKGAIDILIAVNADTIQFIQIIRNDLTANLELTMLSGQRIRIAEDYPTLMRLIHPPEPSYSEKYPPVEPRWRFTRWLIRPHKGHLPHGHR